MKNYAPFLIVVLAIFLTSCEKIKDATAVDIDTELNTSIPVATIEPTAIAIKSTQVAADVFAFGGSSSFSLADNDALVNYIDNIREIKAKDGTVLTFLGAVSGNKIMTLTLKYGFQTGDTAPTMVQAFSIPAELLENEGLIEFYSDAWTTALMSKLQANKDKTVHFELSGTSNYDVQTTVKLKVPMIVSATPL